MRVCLRNLSHYRAHATGLCPDHEQAVSYRFVFRNALAVTVKLLVKSRLERSRGRGGRFACYAPHVMLSVTHRIALLAHAHFLSTAKPIAYRWAKRLNSHSH